MSPAVRQDVKLTPAAPVDADERGAVVPGMADNAEPDLEVKTRLRGGSGRGAEWEWGVYPAGSVEPIANGRTMGAERKAKVAGEAAMKDFLNARRKKPK